MLPSGLRQKARFARGNPLGVEAMHALATLSLHCINTLPASSSKFP
jgi:hypothetical protein